MLAEVPNPSVRERYLMLRTVPAISAFKDDAIRLMAEFCSLRAARKGEVLMHPDEPVHTAYWVVEGSVNVHRPDTEPLLITAPGGIGFISVLADEEGVGAVVAEDAVLLAMPTQFMLDTFEEDFSLARSGLRLAAARIVELRGNLPSRSDDLPPLGEYPQRTATLIERALRTADAILFRDTSIDAVIQICRAQHEMRVEAGHTLWRRGDVSDHTLQVIYGHVRCTNDDGKHVDVGAPYNLGTFDPWAGHPRAYDAVTLTPAVVLRTDHERFAAVLENHFDMWRNLSRLLNRLVLSELRAAEE